MVLFSFLCFQSFEGFLEFCLRVSQFLVFAGEKLILLA
ncbi:MAG: hypothetical protein [Bacteriophage sp.]|nr:MAG: hypothetical protein [Bacteriophage sp.]